MRLFLTDGYVFNAEARRQGSSYIITVPSLVTQQLSLVNKDVLEVVIVKKCVQETKSSSDS